MIFTIKKIYKYNDEIIVYPGHGRETTLDYEKKNNLVKIEVSNLTADEVFEEVKKVIK